MKDLFIDIEALGHVPGCAVIQIGAIIFDSHTGETAEHIQLYIQPEKADPFHADLDTLAWHRDKGTFPHPPEALEMAMPVADAVDALVEFFNSAADAGHEIETVWSWGADYDFPIIEALFERFALGGEAPWEYYQVSDARTVWKLAFPGIKHGPRPHNALEDCRHAVKDLVAALNELTGRELLRTLPKRMGDHIREQLREASKGEPETFGFVQAFMAMIDKAERAALTDGKEISAP